MLCSHAGSDKIRDDGLRGDSRHQTDFGGLHDAGGRLQGEAGTKTLFHSFSNSRLCLIFKRNLPLSLLARAHEGKITISLFQIMS